VAEEVFVLTEVRQRDLIAGVLPEVDASHLILEPSARGTTNAYGLAALTLVERMPDAVMLALPADHVVRGSAQVRKAVRAAVAAAATTGCLVTVGLKPTFPSTGLGYIHAPGRVSRGTLRVRRFIEKPNAATARRFVREGGYYWNLAWFSWRLDLFIDELSRHAPRHLAGLRKVVAARRSNDESTAAELYRKLPVEVIDRTVMEKTGRLLLVPASFDWADIGNWAELGDRVHADARGNSVEGEAVLVDTTGSLVFGDRRLIAAIGLEGMIIVDSEDALLVVPRSRAQDVRRVVDALKRARKTRYL
jgi:mannose-1-phosphate guanylyltransferase/mannose-6-phosphate isomerase